jgi:phosphate-selective porin OprO and OprP
VQTADRHKLSRSRNSGRLDDCDATWWRGLPVLFLWVASLGGAHFASAAEEQKAPFRVHLGGRLMLDTAHYESDKLPLEDASEVRRARLEFRAGVERKAEFALGVEFAGDEPDVLDLNLRVDTSKRSWVTIGQFSEPFSLEEVSSSKALTFLERGLPNVFSPGYRVGLGINGYGRSWSAAAGVFGSTLEDPAFGDGNDDGWGASARMTYLPWHSGDSLVQLGVSAAYRDVSELEHVRIRTRPELHVTDARYLNTGKIKDADNIATGGLEVMTLLGPFSLQGEYIESRVATGDDTFRFSGGYAFVSWFVSGDSRDYARKTGSIGQIEPRHYDGALELALRYSQLNLTDREVTGGSARIITIGVNWYISRNTRAMLNYLMIDNDENADGDGSLPGNDDPNAWLMRLQVAY